MSTPTVTISPTTANVPYKVPFMTTATASDDTGVIVSFAWTVTTAPSGSSATITNAATDTPTFSPDKLGTFVLTCTVTDDSAATATATVTLTVRAEMWVKTTGGTVASIRRTQVAG